MKEQERGYHFFAYLSRMKHIKRWGLMRNTETENIKEHSLDVAILAHALAVIHNTYFGGQLDEKKIMAMGVFHEAGEIMTGDLPTPVKYYNPRMQEAYLEIEKVALERTLKMLPGELQSVYQPLLEHQGDEEYRFVKYADKLCAYIKCVEEVKSGNAEFEKAKCRIAEQIAQIEEPAVLHFIKYFLPSFGLTIDELNK